MGVVSPKSVHHWTRQWEQVKVQKQKLNELVTAPQTCSFYLVAGTDVQALCEDDQRSFKKITAL